MRFSDGIATLIGEGCSVLVEAGPTPVLIGMARAAGASEGIAWCPTLRRGQSDWKTVLESVGRAYVHGVAIDAESTQRGAEGRRIPLPTYVFQGDSYRVKYNTACATDSSTALSALDPGGEEELLRKLGAAGKFTEQELALLPRLLAAVRDLNGKPADAQDAVGKLLYDLTWREHALSVTDGDAASSAGAGEWYILDDAAGTGARVGALLRSRGKQCTVIEAGAAPVFSDASVAGIVYLGGLGANLDDNATGADLINMERRAVGGALHGMQVALNSRSARTARFYIVTRRATSAGDVQPAGLAQATLWGFGSSAALEHPDTHCTRVDLDEVDERALTALADEVLAASSEDRVAFRDGRRWIPRLARTTADNSGTRADEPRIDAAGAYLVTGGLGGLGLRFAQWLHERGARHLVLLGRRAPDAAAETVLAQLREQGATVTVRALNVADASAVAALIAEFGTTLPELRGVLHAAGQLDDGVLLEQRWDRFERVFAAKVVGGWNLHQATRNRALDFFILFSSASALFGNPGQTNNGAANAFLDQLAHVRRAQGLPALSINWGAWAEIGAAAGSEILAQIVRRGFLSFSPEEGVRAAELAMRAGVNQQLVVGIDWALFSRRHPDMPLVAELASASAVSTATGAKTDIRGALESASVEHREALLLEKVRAEVARVIGAEDPSTISAERGFFTLGLDSLTSVELRNRLQRGLRAELPSTVAFDYPTLLSLTAFLRREILVDLFMPAALAVAEPARAAEPEVLVGEAANEPATDADEAAIARELAELQSVLARA